MATIARESGVAVATETSPFASEPTYRLDVVISQGERRVGIDVAITNARLTNPDSYEEVKFRKYAVAAAKERRFILLPVIGTIGTALNRTMARLNRTVARNVGRILARNAIQMPLGEVRVAG